MATYNKFNVFIADVMNKQHDFSADVFKFKLSNTLPNAADVTITEIAAGNGYTAGGEVVTIASSTQTGGVYSASPSGTTLFTATGGAMAQFRYVIFYNSTSNKLISWYDRGASVDLLDGETFEITPSATLFTAS